MWWQKQSKIYPIIKSLVPINEISYKAGDLAILEVLKRMEKVAGEDDVVFRIGKSNQRFIRL